VSPAASQRVEIIPGDEVYAPQIQVIVDGKDLTGKVNGDIIELHVTLEEGQLGGFTLSLTNHFEVPDAGDPNDVNRKFRHSDDEELALFKRVTISMGYAGQVSKLLIAEITSIQATFPSDGAPTLTITGTDYMNRLRQSVPGDDRSKNYHHLADWQIAQQIAERHDLAFSSDSTRKGETHALVAQGTDDDLKFLHRLAKRNDFECLIVIENDQPALLFRKPLDKRDGDAVTQLKLVYGQSLISFTPRLAVTEQLTKLTVRSWNSRKKDKFRYAATKDDLPKTGDDDGVSGPELVERYLPHGKEQRVVNIPVQSQEEAKQRALENFNESAYKFLTGSGQAIGDTRIRPQVSLELDGLGCRYKGVYYVTKTEHVYGASGYSTSFDVKRLRVHECPPKEQKKP
jgi:phage protein D